MMNKMTNSMKTCLWKVPEIIMVFRTMSSVKCLVLILTQTTMLGLQYEDEEEDDEEDANFGGHFASVEEFAHLLENANEDEVNPKQKSWEAGSKGKKGTWLATTTKNLVDIYMMNS